MNNRLILTIRSLNLAPRGLFYQMVELLERTPNKRIDLDEKEIAEKLHVKFPHFSRSLKVLLQKRIIVRTDDGLSCPLIERKRLLDDIRQTFAQWKR